MKQTALILLATTAAAALVTGADPALAQSAPSASSGTTEIAEVIVTAQKRAENIQDVPISMEVVPAKEIVGFHENNLRDIQNYVPNVFVEASGGNNVIYMRGFGAGSANFGFDQDVSLYQDGIYLGHSKQLEAPFFDLDRIEVLNGPQGALFGKNTAAGAVSIVTAGPTDHFEASANAIYNFDLKGFDLSGFVSGPITSTLSARLAVRIVDEDGFILDNFTGTKEPRTREQLARLTLKWAPNSNFDYTTKADYVNKLVTGCVNVSISNTAPQTPPTNCYITPGPGGPPVNEFESWLVSGTGNLHLGDYTLTSITGYDWFKGLLLNGFDADIPGGGVTANTISDGFPERFHQFSQEVRLASPTGHRLEYIVGAYYDLSRYEVDEVFYYDLHGGALAGGQHSHFDEHGDSYSVYGQATYHILDSLRLLGSLRWTNTDKNATYSAHTDFGSPLQPISSAVGSLSEHNIDPSVTLQYDATRQIMFYITYGEGSKSGGFVSDTFGTKNSTFSYLPERSRNYEGGVKATLLSGRLTANASVFDTTISNLQLAVFNPTTNNFVVSNAASATSKGVEFSLAWYPLSHFDITGAAAYQVPEFDNYQGASCFAWQPLTACNPAVPASVIANNLKGVQLTYTSRFSGHIQFHYFQPLPDNLKLDATLIVAGRSGYYDSDNQDPVYGYQKGYAKIDARVQLASDNDRWHIALVGKNLTNEITVSNDGNLPASITNNARAIATIDETRNISIEAGVRF